MLCETSNSKAYTSNTFVVFSLNHITKSAYGFDSLEHPLSFFHNNMLCGWVSYANPSVFMLWLYFVVAELVLCHLRLLATSAFPYMQNSGGIQYLMAGLNSAVSSAYLWVSAQRLCDSLFLGRISGKCDDQSRKRHQQILSACHIKNSVH